jgi:hypothetical protein
VQHTGNGHDTVQVVGQEIAAGALPAPLKGKLRNRCISRIDG